MDIFITWSGPRSLAVAEALREYLPMIVNAFNPWLSKKSLEKGVNWSTELTAALGKAKAGIICLTPSNLTEPWILFEAGAIAKAVTEKPRACTLLIGLKSSDVEGPLAQFQNTTLTRDDLLQLVQNLNGALGEAALKETQVEKAFDTFWPELKKKLDNLPPDGPADKAMRTAEDLLAEILDTVRSTSQENFRLLKFAIDGIASVSDKIPDPLPFTNFAGLNVAGRPSGYMNRLLVGPNYTAYAGSDASTSGNEPPPVPPELLETQSNQPAVSKPRPARREKKFSHASGKPRLPNNPTQG